MSPLKELRSKIALAHSLRLDADAQGSLENHEAAIELYNRIKAIEYTSPVVGNTATQLFKKLEKAGDLARDRIDFLEKSRSHYRMNLEYLNSQGFTNGLLFYPGAGFDFGPLSFFSQVEGVRHVVYADLLAFNQAKLKNTIEKNLPDFTVSDFEPLTFDELLKGPFRNQAIKRMDKIIVKLKDEVEEIIMDPKYKTRAIDDYLVPGVKMKISKNGKTVDFTYFFDEGAAVYKTLLNQNHDARIFVLQDHGFVGPHFGGESDLYQKLKASDRLPEFLYVSMVGTTPWPDYESVNPPLYIKRGQMYNRMRVVFKRQD
jgi:hypothetical protein